MTCVLSMNTSSTRKGRPKDDSTARQQSQKSSRMLVTRKKSKETTAPENSSQQQSALQEIQTSLQPVKNAVHVSDEPVRETSRPTKRARMEKNGSNIASQSTAASRAAMNDVQETSEIVPADSPQKIRRSKRTRQPLDDNDDDDVGHGDVVSVASAPAKPLASDTRQFRPRKLHQEQIAAKKPPPQKPADATTSMNLRKRASVPPSMNTTSAVVPMNDAYKAHRRSIDVGECEVCLHPYALSYLSKHRNKVHGLAHTVYGCPYCLETCSSAALRLQHIHKTHPGQPTHWSVKECSDLNNIKVHMYPCPLCPAHFTHSGLACHLGSSHHTSIEAYQSQVYCVCPFCMAHGKTQAQFSTEQQLRQHVASKHKGCFLLDDIKPPVDRVFTRPNVKSVAVAPKKKASPVAAAACRMEAESSDDEESETWSNVEESSDEHWERLPHHGLISDYMYGNYIPVDFGTSTPSLSTAIKAVEGQLKSFETKDIADDDYVAEMKLYNKGLKDRKQKADAERIEKERYREEVERKLMMIQYENRNKKKRSAEDIEYDEFLDRSILFGLATRESARKSSCPNGDKCELCVSQEQDPETDAAGQLIDAPSYHGTVVGDSLKAVVQSPEASGNKRDSTTGASRRRGRRVDSTTRSILMLQELKHSLRFVAGYNSGYFR